jgi:dipeptidyl aminopeptidase/acylaminoacyl peptidase
MAEALKESNHASVRYVELPLGDHALSREQDRLEVFTELQQFLTKHLE